MKELHVLKGLGRGGAFAAAATLLDMQTTCNYADCMSTMIQIRHVPDSLHRKLKARAATEGLSLSDYVLRQVKQAADQPTMGEILERISRQPKVKLRGSVVDDIRALRGSLNGQDRDEMDLKRQ